MIESAVDLVLEGLKGSLLDDDVIARLDFAKMAAEYDRLSSGEQCLVDVALAIWNGSNRDRAGIAFVLNLDRANFDRVLDALREARQ